MQPSSFAEAAMDSAETIRLGIVRGVSYGVFGPPGQFMPELRALGASVARAYVTWNQVEPEAGRYDWAAVDALLGQLEPTDQVWLTVVSASRWATTTPADFLPASAAKDMMAYSLFVAALVAHCGGRVAYWQCNNEPSNAGLWSGSAEDYAVLAVTFAKAVRSADPKATIVLGGCGYDVLSSRPDSEPRSFFDTVVAQAADAFDLFDVHLYDNPLKIAGHMIDVRAMMRRHGIEKPVVVGEYGGPTLLGFPKLEPAMQQIMVEAFSGPGPSLDSDDLTQQGETPDRKAMRMLYARMASLPPELQMFMQGCPPELEARRHRIAAREIVTRNLLAMAEGVRLTLCWNLAPEVPNYRDPYNLMGFLSDKLALMDFEGTKLSKLEPAAHTFKLLAAMMRGATEVRRLPAGDGVTAIEVDRGEHGRFQVLWAEGETFDGEDQPARSVSWVWPERTATVVDAFGAPQQAELRDGRLALELTVTPLFITT
jgi:hypothetical protein